MDYSGSSSFPYPHIRLFWTVKWGGWIELTRLWCTCCCWPSWRRQDQCHCCSFPDYNKWWSCWWYGQRNCSGSMRRGVSPKLHLECLSRVPATRPWPVLLMKALHSRGDHHFLRIALQFALPAKPFMADSKNAHSVAIWPPPLLISGGPVLQDDLLGFVRFMPSRRHASFLIRFNKRLFLPLFNYAVRRVPPPLLLNTIRFMTKYWCCIFFSTLSRVIVSSDEAEFPRPISPPAQIEENPPPIQAVSPPLPSLIRFVTFLFIFTNFKIKKFVVSLKIFLQFSL